MGCYIIIMSCRLYSRVYNLDRTACVGRNGLLKLGIEYYVRFQSSPENAYTERLSNITHNCISLPKPYRDRPNGHKNKYQYSPFKGCGV